MAGLHATLGLLLLLPRLVAIRLRVEQVFGTKIQVLLEPWPGVHEAKHSLRKVGRASMADPVVVYKGVSLPDDARHRCKRVHVDLDLIAVVESSLGISML